MVANITQLVVVVVRPCRQPDFFIVDRYLCAATAAGIAGAVAINKSDLEANKIDAGGDRRATPPRATRTCICSANERHGLDRAARAARGRR